MAALTVFSSYYLSEPLPHLILPDRGGGFVFWEVKADRNSHQRFMPLLLAFSERSKKYFFSCEPSAG
jgi:hypothetical protein